MQEGIQHIGFLITALSLCFLTLFVMYFLRQFRILSSDYICEVILFLHYCYIIFSHSRHSTLNIQFSKGFA